MIYLYEAALIAPHIDFVLDVGGSGRVKMIFKDRVFRRPQRLKVTIAEQLVDRHHLVIQR